MTAEARMRERAAEVADEAGGVPPENWRVIGDAIRAIPLEGEQGEPVAWRYRTGPDRPWGEPLNYFPVGLPSDAEVQPLCTAPHHHSRPEQAAAVTASPFEAAQPEHLIPAPAREPSAVEEVAIAFAFGRVAAVARRHAAELDRLRAENAALKDDNARLLDSLTKEVNESAELREKLERAQAALLEADYRGVFTTRWRFDHARAIHEAKEKGNEA